MLPVRPLLIAMMLAVAAGPAFADTAARLFWSFTTEPEGDAKLGITAPDANTYALVLMRCRPGSGHVRLNIDIAERDLGAVSVLVRQQRALVVELTAAGATTVATPNLAYNHHDGVWQYTDVLDLTDPLLHGLGSSGRISIKGPGHSYQYGAAAIGQALPAFAAACKSR